MRRWTLMLAAVLLLLLLGWTAQADPLVVWDVAPELGAGMTFAHQQQMTVTLGLRLGTFGPEMPAFPGREFGLDFAQTGGCSALGAWVGIAEVSGVKVRVGALTWKDEAFQGDLYVRVAKAFALDF
jgi:hypothetical protein